MDWRSISMAYASVRSIYDHLDTLFGPSTLTKGYPMADSSDVRSQYFRLNFSSYVSVDSVVDILSATPNGARFDGDPRISRMVDQTSIADFTSIYPNPAYFEIRFATPPWYTSSAVRLFDLLGRTYDCTSYTVRSNTQVFMNIESLPPGAYVVSIADLTFRFIKQ